ncbi:hypothetical protein BT63DRAFT_453813 [Microthyrium microscopicum]|uniref:Uncharacterized protein n=1 Tax=Microthyrium microscopicum TaxID=703497 RepID=A0A6A6UIX8_9PEZI|nr:hypothetical protein BT63DRAFT_453813 [Microthyrium microscopicum]
MAIPNNYVAQELADPMSWPEFLNLSNPPEQTTRRPSLSKHVRDPEQSDLAARVPSRPNAYDLAKLLLPLEQAISANAESAAERDDFVAQSYANSLHKAIWPFTGFMRQRSSAALLDTGARSGTSQMSFTIIWIAKCLWRYSGYWNFTSNVLKATGILISMDY